MGELIEKIRQKPDQQKSKIIWIIISIVGGILLLVWLVVGLLARGETKETNIINNITTDFEDNRNELPDLFNNK